MPSLLVIGLDATDIGRLERLMGEGRMPHLAALRNGAAHGLLESRPDPFVNMVRPALVSGNQAGEHGWHSAKMWRAERMRIEYGDTAWLPFTPFWSALEGSGARMALLDIPFAPPPSERFEGISLSGWQTHDESLARSIPSGLRRRLARRHGRSALGPELFGPQNPASLGKLHRQALASTRRFTDITCELLGEGPFDMFMAVFGAAHRAGHYLWDLSQIDAASLNADRRRALEGALDEIYIAQDAAIGRVLEAAGGRFSHVLLFAAHGMGSSDGWLHMLDAMLARIEGAEQATEGGGLLYRLKKRLPWNLVREVTTRLPAAVNRALVPLWSQRMHDWNRTRAFTVPFDVHGFIRVNLRGRERDGIVDPAGEYEELLDHLRKGIESFADMASGPPASAGVVRSRGSSQAVHAPSCCPTWWCGSASHCAIRRAWYRSASARSAFRAPAVFPPGVPATIIRRAGVCWPAPRAAGAGMARWWIWPRPSWACSARRPAGSCPGDRCCRRRPRRHRPERRPHRPAGSAGDNGGRRCYVRRAGTVETSVPRMRSL